MSKNEVYMTHIHDVNVDTEYGKWLSGLKHSYQQAQVKAAIKVNSEKLLWNWQLGRDLVMRKAEEKWGTGIVEQLSYDLQQAFPNEKGFSTDNLWAMKRWYLFYTEKLDQVGQVLYGTHSQDNIILDQLGQVSKLQQPVSELLEIENQSLVKLHQVGAEIIDDTEGMAFPAQFALVPWRHHVEIIKKCRDVDEALFYLQQTIENAWSRATLMNCIKADLYHKRGGAITNFNEHLPLPQAELAQEITKETYDFGFISLPEGYKEAQLEEALAQQMTHFLLELGKGFAFVGRQKELIIAGRSRRIDLLFYHIYLRCYVVVELKAVMFEPEFAGKLNYYVAAVDEAIKKESDNPTIGLLICSHADKTDVQLAFHGVTTPLGVAAYDNVQLEEITKQLPTYEQLQARIKLLEQELRNKQD